MSSDTPTDNIRETSGLPQEQSDQHSVERRMVWYLYKNT